MRMALVTGGGGFIGSHLAAALAARGEAVRILDNFATGSRQNLAGFPGIEVMEGDLRDPSAVGRAVEGVEVVFHQGALGSVPRSITDPLTTNAVNVLGTLHVLEAARRAGVRRVVYASSSAVYGDTPTLPKEEGMPLGPRSPYAVSKLAGEYYCRVFSEVYGFETVSLRYFNVFGPRQDPTSQYAAVIPRFIAALLKGEPPVVFGDGTQSRDFTYVENVVQANLKAADAPGAAGQVFNVAMGRRATLLDLLETLGYLMSCPVRPRFDPPRPGDVKHSQAAIDRARQILGYVPVVSFEEGLRRTVEWFQVRRDS